MIFTLYIFQYFVLPLCRLYCHVFLIDFIHVLPSIVDVMLTDMSNSNPFHRFSFKRVFGATLPTPAEETPIEYDESGESGWSTYPPHRAEPN